MVKITYPRPCPNCGTKINNRFSFSRHKKYCGTDVKAPCVYCDKVFCRKDKMMAQVRKCHSEAAKEGQKSQPNYPSWNYCMQTKYHA